MELRDKRVLLDGELKVLVDQLGSAKVSKVTQEGKCTITSIQDKCGRISYHFIESDILEYVLASGDEPSLLPTEFEMIIEIPESLVAGEEAVSNVTIKPRQIQDEGFTGVQFQFDTALPSSTAVATYKATDTTGTEYTFENKGKWGPDAGFDMPKDYEATTEWKVTFSEPGEYMIRYNLVRVSDGTVLLTTQSNVNVD